MKRSRTRQIGSPTVAILLAFLLAGCVPFPHPPAPSPTIERPNPLTLTPAQSRANIKKLLDESMTLLGGEWEVAADSIENCTLPDGSEGALPSFGIGGPGVPNEEDAAKTMHDFWVSKGYENVRTYTMGPNLHVQYGPDDTGLYFRYWPGLLGSSFDATGQCVPPGPDIDIDDL